MDLTLSFRFLVWSLLHRSVLLDQPDYEGKSWDAAIKCKIIPTFVRLASQSQSLRLSLSLTPVSFLEAAEVIFSDSSSFWAPHHLWHLMIQSRLCFCSEDVRRRFQRVFNSSGIYFLHSKVLWELSDTSTGSTGLRHLKATTVHVV